MLPARDLARIQRLRELFLDEGRGGPALHDYWRDAGDLAAYDAVLGARIGWKWDAALGECVDRGFARADGDVVLDYGCGSGIAASRFVHHFGAKEVLCHDRSAKAMTFAVDRLRREHPELVARPRTDLATIKPDVLLVSHVLSELDLDGRAQLLLLIHRSRRVLLVEPGNCSVSRKLSTLRDELLPTFHVVAPCPHQATCPSLTQANDWCHFFAAPPPEVFTNGDWVKTGRELGIDLRSLPYAFVALERSDAETPAASTTVTTRVLGRPTMHAHTAEVQVCRADGLAEVEVTKRHDAATWRALKKHPETVRTLPADA